MMLAALAVLDDSGAREVYDRLRAAYNLSRPGGASPPVPPMEEWRGMSMICGDLQCRYTKKKLYAYAYSYYIFILVYAYVLGASYIYSDSSSSSMNHIRQASICYGITELRYSSLKSHIHTKIRS